MCSLARSPGVSEIAEELQATLVDLAEKYHTLEAFCEQLKTFELPVVSLATAERFDYSDAGRLAHQVRNQLGLGERPGPTLLRVLEEVCNVRVFHLEFEPQRKCSLHHLGAVWSRCIAQFQERPLAVRNFDLAHELFHLLTWNVFRHGDGEQPVTSSDREEKLATCFARNLLMPEEVFREAVDAQRDKSGSLGFDGLFEVAREFDVSTEAVSCRSGSSTTFHQRNSSQP